MSSSSLLISVAGLLPTSESFQDGIRTIQSDEKASMALEAVLCLCAGAPPLETLHSSVSPAQWADARARLQPILDSLAPNVSHASSSSKSKRPLEEDAENAQQQTGKKAKVVDAVVADDPDDTPIFTLHNISLTSPIRKKADITVHKATLRFTDPKDPSRKTNLCDPISIRRLRNAFMVSTPGKSKPHWTVMILSARDASPTNSIQVIFGCDATLTSPQTTTNHPSPPETHPKGSPSKSLLHSLFAYFPSGPDGLVDLYEPKSSDFSSGQGGGQSIDAYIGAKDGHLHFFANGVLWGEKKPCIWFPTTSVVDMHTSLATGRSFTLYISVRRKAAPADGGAGGDEEDDENEVEMHDFSLIDSKEEEPVKAWIAKHKQNFATTAPSARDSDAMQVDGEGDAESRKASKAIAKAAASVGRSSGGPIRLMDAVLDENDEEDGDFEGSDSDSDSGSSRSSDSEAEDGGGEEGEGEASAAESEDGESDGNVTKPSRQDVEGDDQLDD